ncbi:MAG: DUF4381 family protein [Gloeobacteraceae cyanobacterium ES-bin-144]|nr:DUF4381 family protein [Verrucomicrobiales bacterium]
MNEKTTGFELMEPASPEALIPDYGLWPLMLAAALLTTLTIVAVIIICHRKKSSTVDPGAIRNAAKAEAAVALSALSSLDSRNVAVQASLILRKYLSVAANDPALYETREEFIARNDALQALDQETRTATETTLNRLGTLKYSPEIPATSPEEIITESKSLLEKLHCGFAS